MSPFTIFVLIVTFLYVIYYAAIITIDMNAKPKSESDTSETLDTEGMVQGDVSDETDESTEDTSSEPADETTDSSEIYRDESYEGIPQTSETDKQSDNVEDGDSSERDDSLVEPIANPNQQVEDDNPYGLTDEPEESSPFSHSSEEVSDDSIATDEKSGRELSAEGDSQPEDNQEPELKIFEPKHENGGLAENINNSNEPIQAESLTPCKPEMLATNIFDIVGIKRSYYGSESKQQSTLSEKQPMEKNEESFFMDKI